MKIIKEMERPVKKMTQQKVCVWVFTGWKINQSVCEGQSTGAAEVWLLPPRALSETKQFVLGPNLGVEGVSVSCVQLRCTLRTEHSLFLHRYRGVNTL